MKQDKDYYNDTLLEIEIENLPVSCIMIALSKMKDFMLKKFEICYGLICDSFNIYATSRKLILIITNLQYTSKNKNKNNKKYMNILLSKVFIDLIRNMSFSKNMIWNDSKFKFARPIRNIVAIYGKQLIKLYIAEVHSSRFSNINIYTQEKIKIDVPANYVSCMKRNFIIVDQNKRYKLLQYNIKRLLANIGTILYNERLINEVTYLVDYPYPILCSFNIKYLQLPSQIINVCINNQKCFTILNKDNTLSNYFICIVNRHLRNRNMDNTVLIRNDYERVIESTLEDAQYFYNHDINNKIISKLGELQNVVFHNKIGSVYEKIKRIKKIAIFLNKEFFNMQVNNQLLTKAIELSKTDILGKLVFEYPELQGTAGKMYALKLGESNDVANAIEQHYWPINANSDTLPVSILATIISLADRLDTLVTSFTVNIMSSGSTDPYGLRRICIGFLKIIKKHLVDINLDYIIKKTFALNNNNAKMPEQIYNIIMNFFKHRLNFMLMREGYGLKEIQVTLNSINTIGALSVLYNKLNVLNNFTHHKQFKDILLVIKRVNNVLKQAIKNQSNISTTINERLFTNDSEQNLYNKIKNFNIITDDYTNFFNYLIELSLIINDFFSKVMIMSPNQHIKQNRLSLLNKTKHIFTNIIDLSLYLL
ncbi:MAG: glycine--tRNA ligase subunit beta [Endomicrobium sp.]|jgi:glycyl-tRNA synthetase beta chain|nr:glycine--tRNA ligase subunit beta [Endomicrobium sp.]